MCESVRGVMRWNQSVREWVREYQREVNSWAEWSECGIVTRLLLTSDRLLILNHPLLLSIIKIIESGLQVLLSQAANAVRSAGRKSDCLLLTLLVLHYLLLCTFTSIYICNLSLILTFALIYLLSSLTHACLLVVPFLSKFLTYETIWNTHVYFIFVTQSFIYIKNVTPLHM